MNKAEVAKTNEKMALVAAVVQKFGVGRNDALKAKMETMRAALLANDPAVIEISQDPCVIRKCEQPRKAGRVVCVKHLRESKKRK